MTTQNEPDFQALKGTLERIDQTLGQDHLPESDARQLDAELDALDAQLAGQAGPLKCPITGEPMAGFKLLDATGAASGEGLWFAPGHLETLLNGVREDTPEASLEQMVLELETQQAKSSQRARIRRLRAKLRDHQGSIIDPHLTGIAREIGALKDQAKELERPSPAVGAPNITPHPGALVSLIRADEKPCYLYAHAGSKTWLGRSRKCNVRIDDPKVSRHHCVIISAGKNWYLVDLDSSNGTFVNGQRLETPVRLCHGDTICLGKAATMEFSMISIAVNEENFYNLALRRLNGEATEDEREELDEMLAEKPELRAEFDTLRHGAEVAQAALPLVDAMNAPAIPLPEGAEVRLQEKVKETFRVDCEAVAAASAPLSPQSGQPLTSVRITDDVELEMDLNHGPRRGGIFVRRDQLATLMRQKSAPELLAKALEQAAH